MASQNENVLPGIIFIATIWALITYTPFQMAAYFIAIALWLVGMAAVRFVGHSHFRLGPRAWLLTLQIGLWFALFLFFFPADLPPKILTVWGIGVPLVFVGAGARWVHGRFPQLHEALSPALVPVAGGAVAVGTLACWIMGLGLVSGFCATLATGAMAAIPLYYGWQFARPLPRGERDARFGSGESFRDAGMSDER